MKPLFDVCLIARNEEKTLPRLLKSLEEFKARGGKIFLLDTGSTDKTADIAEEFGCHVERVGAKFRITIDEKLAKEINAKFVVEEAPVVQAGDSLFDYASARNYIADFAEAEVIATPDCDEIYTRFDIDELNRVISEGAEQLEYNFVFSHDQYGNEALKFTHCKFYNRKKMHWVGVIHEVLAGEARRVRLPESVIKLEHWQNHETSRGHYLVGLALDCYQNPDNDRNSHYLGRELLWTNRPKSAIKELTRHREMNRWPTEKAQSLIYIARAKFMLDDDAGAIADLFKAFTEDPHRREALLTIADYYTRQGKPQEAAVCAFGALQINKSDYYADLVEHYTWYPHKVLAWALPWLGRKQEGKEHFDKALSFLPDDPSLLSRWTFHHWNPKVSIVIPTLGREEKLQRLLDTIPQTAWYDNYEVIVMQDSFENRKGVPKLVKEGVEKSTGELVMYLGNDIIPQPGFLLRAVMAMEGFDGLVGLNDMYWHGELATHWLASKKLLPYLGGEFFHTGYLHTGCDNELTNRCRKIGKYKWAENAKVYHDHPVQTGSNDLDEVYKIAYDPKNLDHDKELLQKRSEELGFQGYMPMFPPIVSLLKRLPAAHEDMNVLCVSIGPGTSSLAQQLPWLKFKKLTFIDVHKPYLDEGKKVFYRSPTAFMHMDVRDFPDIDKYDLVLFFDVLEHIEKEDAIKVVKKCKKKVLIFGPLEDSLHNHRHDVDDIPSQDHLSLWTEQDFKDLGFTTELLLNFHHEHGKSFPAVWAWNY